MSVPRTLIPTLGRLGALGLKVMDETLHGRLILLEAGIARVHVRFEDSHFETCAGFFIKTIIRSFLESRKMPSFRIDMRKK